MNLDNDLGSSPPLGLLKVSLCISLSKFLDKVLLNNLAEYLPPELVVSFCPLLSLDETDPEFPREFFDFS